MTQQDSALILVVDDDELTRQYLRDLMVEEGYRVAEASNGVEAIANYTRFQPDLVLLDALMPVMDGFSCCTQLLSLSNGESVPILMITAFYDQASINKAFAAGATDLINKPIHSPILSQRVRRLLEASHTVKELRQQTEAAKLREAQLQIALGAAQMGTWDWDFSTNTVTWSDNKTALLGLEKGAFDGTYEGFLRSIYPLDRDFVHNSVMRAITEGAVYDIEFRTVLPDGNIRWLFSKGVVWRNSSGVAVGMSGINMDITKHKLAQERLESYAQQQAIVAELSQMALAGTDLSRLMNSCVMLVSQCLKVDACKVLELLPDGSALLLRAQVGEQQVLVSNTKSFSTLLTQEPIPMEKLDTQRLCSQSLMLDEQSVMGCVSVVIHGKDRPFGVLRANATQEYTFSKDDIYFLQAVANVLATAIERQRVEDALKKSEERFETVARVTSDAVWERDLLTNQVCWNLPVETVFGYSAEQINSHPNWWRENLHPDDRRKVITDLQAVIDSGQQFWSKEYRFRRSDGSYAEISERGYVIRDSTGKPVRMIGGILDISDVYYELRLRKQAQAELQRQNLRSQLFADITLKIRQSLQIDEILQTSVTEVQKLLHSDRVLILQLKSNTSFFAVQEATVSGLPILRGQEFIDPCFWENYIPKYRQGDFSSIADIYQANIEPCYVQLLEKYGVRAKLVIPIFRKNELWGLLVIHQCTHPRNWIEWEIEFLRQLADQIGIALAQSLILEQETRQRQELARSNEELQQFAFIASHDLQEPLRKIKSFGERLKAICGATLTAQGLDYLERMQNAAQRMETLIEDLLRLSRITTRAQPFVTVNLGQIVQEVLSDLEVYIQQMGGRVEVGELPTITADSLQMRQLLQNLIVNALKFHKPQIAPVVKIFSQILNSQSDKVFHGDELCQIVVEDNGIGFEEKYVDSIFNAFQRLHSSKDYKGTGIGLAICRKIAERHHGSITAQSQVGRGSRFIVTLPVNSHI